LIQAPFKPESKNTLSGLNRHVGTGQNGSIIIGRDSTLKSMSAVQRLGATSMVINRFLTVMKASASPREMKVMYLSKTDIECGSMNFRFFSGAVD